MKPARQKMQKSATTTTEIGRTSGGFTPEERAAMRERPQELRGASRRGPGGDTADAERAVLAKLAEMPGPDRAMGGITQGIVRTLAPALSPRLWYGMPAYAKGGKVVCFFRST